MEIKITDVRIFKIKQRGALLGYANIVLNDSFIIRGIRILENERNGRFVSMPSRRLREKKRAYRDLCHPINQETRDLITTEIFNAYDAIENVEE
jgi:DNA-binding cell septation regulator SpoVG